MKSKFSRFFRLSLPFLLSLVLVFTLAAPVSAAVGFFNYDDYASYSLSSDGLYKVWAELPASWSGTIVWSADWGRKIFNRYDDDNFSFSAPASDRTLCFQISPLGGNLGGSTGPGSDLSSAGIMDASNLPSDVSFEYSYSLTFESGFDIQTIGKSLLTVFYTDSSGKVVQVESFSVSPVQSDGSLILSGSFSPSYLSRDDVSGLCFYFSIANLGVTSPYNGRPYNVSINYSYLRMVFDISESLYNLNNSGRLQGSLNDIKDQLLDQGIVLDDILTSQDKTNDLLDDAINGDTDSVSPDGSDIVGDVDDLEDKLFDSVSGGLDAADSIFSSSSSFVYSLAPAFVFVSSMCNDLWNFGPFGNLLQVSLGLGVCASILGLGFSALRSRSPSRSHGYTKAKKKGE